MDKINEIRRLYYSATAATIQRDLARAVELLRSLPTDAERERAAVYMDGLAQMRGEWQKTKNGKTRPQAKHRT